MVLDPDQLGPGPGPTPSQILVQPGPGRAGLSAEPVYEGSEIGQGPVYRVRAWGRLTGLGQGAGLPGLDRGAGLPG